MSRIVRFGNFEVDLAGGQLHKRGVRIGLREKSFQVLALLLERPGEVVTREELRRRLWPSDVFVDFDNNLNTSVARLREALGDQAEHPRFVETLPRHGYRFIAAVTERLPASGAPAAAPRIVVLPFLNLSGDPAQEYFSDAMTDEIITELAGLAPDALNVIARTTAMRYKGSRKDVTRIARELGVEYVVEGGVRRAEDRIALNVQLVRASDRMHVFAKRYQAAALTDIFRMQSCAARDIAANIGSEHIAGTMRATDNAGAMGRRPRTHNPAAYDEYLRGRSQMARVTPDAFARGRRHLEAAVSLDPGFALAYDGLAELYWYLAYFGFMPPREAFSTGVLYAIRTLEIDNSLGETHALLGLYHKLSYDWPEVEREMARALELSPTSPVVRERYAFNFLMPHARHEEAAAELELALAWDPQSVAIRSQLTVVLALGRHYQRAVDEARGILDIEPQAYWGHALLGGCLRDQGLFDEAIAAYRTALELSGGASSMMGWLGLCLALAGHTSEARTMLDQLAERAAQSYVPPTSLAWIHLGLGEIDSAFEWLDRAVEGRDQFMMPIKGYSFFDPIRSDPRFAALLRSMRLDG
ncbi:MAG TPA: winged helix-turn-helix domain-containing protein [Vicinamibacterales bacterium]|nr:winged helix-turn-helix domain-containing protein [Vicinamibacterales bacterium]